MDPLVEVGTGFLLVAVLVCLVIVWLLRKHF